MSDVTLCDNDFDNNGKYIIGDIHCNNLYISTNKDSIKLYNVFCNELIVTSINDSIDIITNNLIVNSNIRTDTVINFTSDNITMNECNMPINIDTGELRITNNYTLELDKVKCRVMKSFYNVTLNTLVCTECRILGNITILKRLDTYELYASNIELKTTDINTGAHISAFYDMFLLKNSNYNFRKLVCDRLDASGSTINVNGFFVNGVVAKKIVTKNVFNDRSLIKANIVYKTN